VNPSIGGCHAGVDRRVLDPLLQSLPRRRPAVVRAGISSGSMNAASMPALSGRFTICPRRLHRLSAVPLGLALGAESFVIESLIHGEPFISRADIIGPS
jgi:hypothetical protein